jgi:thymidine kinase
MSDYQAAVAEQLNRMPSICAVCKEPFWPTRRTQKYCDAVCSHAGDIKRSRAWRAVNRYRGGCS